MFSMCSELTPRAHIPDTRIAQLMHFCTYAYFPQRGLNLKICVLPFFSVTIETHKMDHSGKKNKICWRGLFEKKPLFSLLTNGSQKYILKWSYWPEILAPGLKLIFVTTLFSNFFHFTQPLPSWQPPLKWGKGGIFALLAQNDQKLTSEGLKWPQ